jgi:hypothetical protein
MTQPDVERRRERRDAFSGEIVLVLDGVPSVSLRGQLVEVSQSGFRVRHTFPDLACGSELTFQHPAGHGRARVIWNRFVDGGCESGLLLLRQG